LINFNSADIFRLRLYGNTAEYANDDIETGFKHLAKRAKIIEIAIGKW